MSSLSLTRLRLQTPPRIVGRQPALQGWFLPHLFSEVSEVNGESLLGNHNFT